MHVNHGIHHIVLYCSLQPFFHCCLCLAVGCVIWMDVLPFGVRGEIQAASLSCVQQKGLQS